MCHGQTAFIVCVFWAPAGFLEEPRCKGTNDWIGITQRIADRLMSLLAAVVFYVADGCLTHFRIQVAHRGHVQLSRSQVADGAQCDQRRFPYATVAVGRGFHETVNGINTLSFGKPRHRLEALFRICRLELLQYWP